MDSWRLRIVYFVLLPAIAIAAAVLGYFTYLTASQYERLGEQSVVQSTLLLVQEKVDQVEQRIIAADNAVFDLVDLSTPQNIETVWPSMAPRISPSVRAVFVLDETGEPIAMGIRASSVEQKKFLKLFKKKILPDLKLKNAPRSQLLHLHKRYGDQSVLVSHKAVEYDDKHFHLVAHHDTGYIVRVEFPELFASKEGKRLFNVVDENQRRLFGPDLSNAGDFLVGRRFPTTLYGWRLQVAPKQAHLLRQQERTRAYGIITLLTLSFCVILVGILFFLYAAYQERQLNALKSEFIANVSHELKTPLSVIRMFSEMLLTKRVKNEQKEKEYLDLICRESERLTGLIENVLDFSAVEYGKHTYQRAPNDLSALIQRAMETVRFRSEQQGVTIDLQNAEAIPPFLFDEQALMLAVINLLDNAVKYGGGTPVEVTLFRAGTEVHFEVRDHGPGIPAEDLRKVFKRFYRTKQNRHIRGSGIGLALVKHVIEAHKGRVWADNHSEGGARFGFALPING